MNTDDMATEAAEIYLLDCEARRKSSRKVDKLERVGYCHSCYEDVGEHQLFCNDICATNYEIANKKKR